MGLQKITWAIFFLLITNLGFSQNEEIEKIEGVVKTFFEGFHGSNETVIRNAVHKDLTMQSVFKNKEGITKLNNGDAESFIKAVVDRAKKEVWTEKIQSYTTNVDGVLATVWTPYEFYLGEQYIHCGVNVFTLIKQDGKWKILTIIDTRRKKCNS